MSRRALTIVVAVQFVALMVVCLLIGDNGWDDGAITLAFARTFARHGAIALTAHSETVEGFSTVSWFLLNALVDLARPSYHTAILASQILSVLCICASTVLLARTCALAGLNSFFTNVTVIVFAAWGCSFSEASNGMEMGLLAAAFLLILNELLSGQPRGWLMAVGVALAVTTRFEALAYVGILSLALLVIGQRRAFWTIVLTSAASVSLLTVWRLTVFSDVVPNTYWAKRWLPYAGFSALERLTSAVELLQFFVVPLLVIEILIRSGFDLPTVVRTHRNAFVTLAAPVLGAVLVGGIVGTHWGYEGRMPYFAFPLMLLLTSLAFSSWLKVKTSKMRRVIVLGAYACTLFASRIGFPFGPLSALFHAGYFDVSVHAYAETAQTFRRFASAGELAHPRLLTPDTGGLALCCEEFRVVDLALLSNRQLAHRGYAGLADQLTNESPELVEAHWEWAALGKLYNLPYFREHYIPAFADGVKLWLRRDVARTIENKGGGCARSANRADLQAALKKHRYADHDTPDDRAAFERTGFVFVLNQADASLANLCQREDAAALGLGR